MADLSRLLRFACVGASVALIYIALYLAFLAFGWAQALANAAAFGVAVAFQYVAQAGFTFRAKLKDGGQALRFAWMIGCGLVTSALITGVLAPAAGLSDALAALIVTFLLPVQNYLLMSRWVFRPQRKTLEFKT